MFDIWLLPATFFFSFLGTWLIVHFATHRQWLDTPNARSSHSTPTPTSGGVAIFIVFALALWWAFRQDTATMNPYPVLFLTACIALVGLADDICQLGIVTRISSHVLVVGAALALYGLPAIPLPGVLLELGWLGYPLGLVVLLWFINLFNFMDGIDGLAATETLFVCLAMVLISQGGQVPDLERFLLLLAASVSGFLVLNLAPAKIFMGDVGSNVLGYLLIVGALASTVGGVTSVWVWLILTAAFIVDATYTLFARMLKGETWYFAHRTHAYQLGAGFLGSHGKVVMLVGGINVAWLLPLAWLAQSHQSWGLGLTVVAWAPLALLVHVVRTRLTARTMP